MEIPLKAMIHAQKTEKMIIFFNTRINPEKPDVPPNIKVPSSNKTPEVR